MAYKRKTRDYFVIQGDYGFGFEDVSAESTWKDTKATLKAYRENEPNMAFKVLRKRESIIACQ